MEKDAKDQKIDDFLIAEDLEISRPVSVDEILQSSSSKNLLSFSKKHIFIFGIAASVILLFWLNLEENSPVTEAEVSSPGNSILEPVDTVLLEDLLLLNQEIIHSPILIDEKAYDLFVIMEPDTRQL